MQPTIKCLHTMFPIPSSVVAALAVHLFSQLTLAILVRHDATYQPDQVLWATAGNVMIDCESRFSVLFNGTTPGPVLYLEEGKTTWVRVYNHIPNENLTVASTHSESEFTWETANSSSTGTA